MELVIRQRVRHSLVIVRHDLLHLRVRDVEAECSHAYSGLVVVDGSGFVRVEQVERLSDLALLLLGERDSLRLDGFLD